MASWISFDRSAPIMRSTTRRSTTRHRPDVDTLKELIAGGMLKPVIDRRYPINQVVAALRLLDGHACGEVVITFE